MISSQLLRRTLSQSTFEQLYTTLLQQSVQPSKEIILFTDEMLPADQSLQLPVQKFLVMIAPQYCGVLTGWLDAQAAASLDLSLQSSLYQIELSFDAKVVSEFLRQLMPVVADHPSVLKHIKQLLRRLATKTSQLPSELVLTLLDILSPPEPVYPFVSVCKPVEDALSQQIEQDTLLNQVVSQIRQSLELPVILNTAVEQVRNHLKTDRLVIYQFDMPAYAFDAEPSNQGHQQSNPSPDLPYFLISPASPTSSLAQTSISPARQTTGRITYEAKASDAILSILNWMEGQLCFNDIDEVRSKYRKGFTQAVEDIETAYHYSPCFLDLMQRAQVRAKLVTPIVVQDKLWGLLIAHQCHTPRHWHKKEKEFLKEIAEHLAIAIYQAQLYAELQQQKQTLEQRVIERTQELHDALIAAQSASRAKSEFLATMSHELRTPLTCVIGMSATLLRWSLGQLNEKQRHYLQTIHSSGEHLLNLINDILDISQLEAGKTVLNISQFPLSILARNSLQSQREKAIESQVELVLDVRIAPEQDIFSADKRRLQQVLYNLLSNAVKFTPAGGKVTLRVWVEYNAAIFQVEDTGIGIAEHQLPLLFQKFQQLDPSYHRKYSGTGLGLALTKQLVELHGGSIEVESTVDVGSIFTVWLPYQSINLMPAALREEANSLPMSSHQRIILVESDEEIATLICEILTAADYQVVWLMEGSTALEQIKHLQPNAVIIDMQLADMDGYELIHHLRNSTDTDHLKVLLLKNQEKPENRESFFAIEADDFLIKPIQPEQLLVKLLQLTILQQTYSS